MDIRRRATAFAAMRRAFAVACLWPLVTLAQPQSRLEPHERERLRHELREQAREERHRMREERHRMRDAGPPADGALPGHAPAPRPYGRADWRSEAPEPGRQGDARARMSPEEREALRLQLRERRRGGD